MPKYTDRPRLKAHYQGELAEDITGIPITTIKKYAKRHDITLAEAIRQYAQNRV